MGRLPSLDGDICSFLSICQTKAMEGTRLFIIFLFLFLFSLWICISHYLADFPALCPLLFFWLMHFDFSVENYLLLQALCFGLGSEMASGMGRLSHVVSVSLGTGLTAVEQNDDVEHAVMVKTTKSFHHLKCFTKQNYRTPIYTSAGVYTRTTDTFGRVIFGSKQHKKVRIVAPCCVIYFILLFPNLLQDFELGCHFVK